MRPVQRDLIEWWSREGRDLPWRRSRDPWGVADGLAVVDGDRCYRLP